MPLPLIWMAGAAAITATVAWYADKPETINNYNFDSVEPDAVSQIINETSANTLGDSLGEIGGGLTVLALAMTAIYVLKK